MSFGPPLHGLRRERQRGGIISRLLFLLVLMAFLAILFLFRYPLLRLAGGFWIVDQSPDAADAIVILGDDNYSADRANHAAELFKSGRAPRIIASGRYLRPYASIAELEAHDLADRGVPASAVVRLPHRAENTREEARAISQLLASHGWKRVLLVTSNYHTRRSEYICEREFPQGTFLHVVSAPDGDYNPDSWWKTRGSVKIFFHESVGMVVALWEERHEEVHTTGSGFFGFLDPPRLHLVAFTYRCGLHSSCAYTIVPAHQDACNPAQESPNS